MDDQSGDGLDDELLAEQLGFYRADAESFDRWLSSLVGGDPEDPKAGTYQAGRRRIAEVFRRRAPLGRVLEIAGGTGRLAELYLPHAASVVLLDASPESLALAARRLGPAAAGRITFVEADVFVWDDDRTFDTVIFAAWLHHVPHARLASFWRRVDRVLAAGGEVIFDFPDARLTSPVRVELPDEPTQHFSGYPSVDGISTRDLGGRRWRVVHNLWDPDALGRRLANLGWEMEVLGAGLFSDVQWASARRRPPPSGGAVVLCRPDVPDRSLPRTSSTRPRRFHLG